MSQDHPSPPAQATTQDPASAGGNGSNELDPVLVDLLRCPLTRSRLKRADGFLVAEVGGLRYPIRDGIPVMLPEEASLPAGVGSLDEFKMRFKEYIRS